MKLASRILIHMLWLLSLLVAAWAVLFYFTLIDEIDDEVNDSLENRAEVLIRQSLADRPLPMEDSSYSLRDVSADYAASVSWIRYSDEEVYFPVQEERQQARVLRIVFRDDEGAHRELTVMAPTIEKDDLQEAIFRWIVCLYAALLLTILLVNWVILHRMLRPLYALLKWLDAYTVGRTNTPLANDTSVTEFRRLNDAACRNAARAEQLFDQQKQFIGNASHEMQTPLAVCRNRLEMLVDGEQTLSAAQLDEVANVQRSLDYLVRLNKSLLLLSKIDNGQFPEPEPVGINALVKRTVDDLHEIYGVRGVRPELCEEGALTAQMNPALASSLVSNLLKNAFVHTTSAGQVQVSITCSRLTVCNSGDEPLDSEHLFERFCQSAKKEGSTGLGLSIVAAICRLYQLKIAYIYSGGRHCFSVEFPV